MITVNCKVSVEDFNLDILKKNEKIYQEFKQILANMGERDISCIIGFEIGEYQDIYDYDDPEYEEEKYEEDQYNNLPTELEILQNITDTQYPELVEFLATNYKLDFCHVYVECERE